MQTHLLSELHAVSAIGQSAVPKVPSAVTLTRRLEQIEVVSDRIEPSALKKSSRGNRLTGIRKGQANW